MVEAGGIKAYYGNTFGENALVPVYVFLRSIKLLLFTVNYAAAYSFSMVRPVFCLKNVSALFLAVLLFGIAILSLRWTKVFFFSFFFFVATLLPFMNILPISTLLADRYLFIASFAYAFLFGVLFERLYALRHARFSEGFFKLVAVVVLIFLLAGHSLMTIQQNMVWHDSYTLWSDAVEKYPESQTANALMGVVHVDRREDEKAIPYLEKAVQILPRDYLSHNNLGVAYGRLGQFEKAMREYQIAMQLRPDDPAPKINLSLLYLKQREFDRAEEILKSLVAINPGNVGLLSRLLLVYKEKGDYPKAAEVLKAWIQLRSQTPNLYDELGSIYLSRFKDQERAKYYFTRGSEVAGKGNPKGEEMRWMLQDIER
jgi:tetratricopeptide (TPR) repeat protein